MCGFDSCYPCIVNTASINNIDFFKKKIIKNRQFFKTLLKNSNSNLFFKALGGLNSFKKSNINTKFKNLKNKKLYSPIYVKLKYNYMLVYNNHLLISNINKYFNFIKITKNPYNNINFIIKPLILNLNFFNNKNNINSNTNKTTDNNLILKSPLIFNEQQEKVLDLTIPLDFNIFYSEPPIGHYYTLNIIDPEKFKFPFLSQSSSKEANVF